MNKQVFDSSPSFLDNDTKHLRKSLAKIVAAAGAREASQLGLCECRQGRVSDHRVESTIYTCTSMFANALERFRGATL